jgi:hypothetical protein
MAESILLTLVVRRSILIASRSVVVPDPFSKVIRLELRVQLLDRTASTNVGRVSRAEDLGSLSSCHKRLKKGHGPEISWRIMTHQGSADLRLFTCALSPILFTHIRDHDHRRISRLDVRLLPSWPIVILESSAEIEGEPTAYQDLIDEIADNCLIGPQIHDILGGHTRIVRLASQDIEIRMLLCRGD